MKGFKGVSSAFEDATGVTQIPAKATRKSQNWKGLEPEVRRRLEHVDRRDLQRDGLQLCQQVQVHKVLLAEEASALSSAVDGRRLDDQLDFRNARLSVHHENCGSGGRRKGNSLEGAASNPGLVLI